MMAALALLLGSDLGSGLEASVLAVELFGVSVAPPDRAAQIGFVLQTSRARYDSFSRGAAWT